MKEPMMPNVLLARDFNGWKKGQKLRYTLFNRDVSRAALLALPSLKSGVQQR
jgi:hypothetical protein